MNEEIDRQRQEYIQKEKGLQKELRDITAKNEKNLQKIKSITVQNEELGSVVFQFEQLVQVSKDQESQIEELRQALEDSNLSKN